MARGIEGKEKKTKTKWELVKRQLSRWCGEETKITVGQWDFNEDFIQSYF
jgi:hypothetical protein